MALYRYIVTVRAHAEWMGQRACAEKHDDEGERAKIYAPRGTGEWQEVELIPAKGQTWAFPSERSEILY